MHKRDPCAATTHPGFLVDEASALGPKVCEGGVDVGYRVGDMVHAFAAGTNELADRRLLAERLQQLDVRPSHGNHRFLDSLALHHLAMNRFDPVQALVFGQRRVEITHGDADVVDVDEEHARKVRGPPPSTLVELASMDMRSRPPIAELRRIYEESNTIAVVGASPDPAKRAHVVPAYLADQGYRIIPVNPNHDEVLGEPCYPTLLEIPEAVDIVDVFRPPIDAPDVAAKAVQIGAKVLWLQLGIQSDEASRIAQEAGLAYIEDHCIGQMHAMLGLGPGPGHSD